MKKFVVFFIILLSLIVIAGCGSKKEVTRFSGNKEAEKEPAAAIEVVDDVNPGVDPVKTLNQKPEAAPDITPEENTVEFAVASLEENILKSDKGYHLIQGTTPKNTHQIIVNDYALSKYKPGDTKWSYIAATSLGTLKKGENDYSVKAIDKDENVIASQEFTIVYNGISGGILAATGSNLMFAVIFTAFMAFGLYSLRRHLASA